MIDDAARHHFWCEWRGCEDDASAMFNWLLDRVGSPSEQQNMIIIGELLRGNLGPLDSRESVLKNLVGTLVNRGYDFDFENGEDCTLVMQSLSYLRDEEWYWTIFHPSASWARTDVATPSRSMIRPSNNSIR